MKKLIIIIALMFAAATQAQDTFSVSVVQDVKLAFTEDNHGNIPYTMDLVIKLEKQWFYIVFYSQAELADLYGGFYQRYAIGVGYSFNTLLENLTLTGSYNYGLIRRFEQTFFGSEVQAEASFRIYKGLSLAALCSYTDRIEIGDWTPNAYFGLKYDFPN